MAKGYFLILNIKAKPFTRFLKMKGLWNLSSTDEHALPTTFATLITSASSLITI